MSGQLRNRINELLNPNAATPDASARSAAANLASGQAPGSQFGANRGLILRDSELRDRYKQADSMLQPLLQQDAAERMAASSQAAAERLAGMQDQQAMDRLKLEQQGASDRLGAELGSRASLAEQERAAALERLGIQNTAEMDKLRFSEGSATERQAAQIAASLAERTAAEAGMDRRQSMQLEQAIKLAGLENDWRTQLQVLQDAGLDRRQALQIQSQMEQLRTQGDQRLQELRLQGQNQMQLQQQQNVAGIIQSLLSGANRSGGGGGSASRGGSPVFSFKADASGNVDFNSNPDYRKWLQSEQDLAAAPQRRNQMLLDDMLNFYDQPTQLRDWSAYF